MRIRNKKYLPPQITFEAGKTTESHFFVHVGRFLVLSRSFQPWTTKEQPEMMIDEIDVEFYESDSTGTYNRYAFAYRTHFCTYPHIVSQLYRQFDMTPLGSTVTVTMTCAFGLT